VSEFETFDKSQLYVNLYTTLELPPNIPVISDLSGNTHPVIIDTNVQPFLTYTVDPDGFLFGNTPCGIDNYLHYQTYLNKNEKTYYSLGSGINNNGLRGTIYCIALDSYNNVYIGGLFTNAGNVSVYNIAKYNIKTLQWSSLGTQTFNSNINSIAIDSSNNIYVGGDFTNIGPYIAKWTSATNVWSSIGGPTNPSFTSYPIYCIKFDNYGNLWVGTESSGESNSQSLALYTPSSGHWNWNGNVQGQIYCIDVDVNNNLYIGGNFTIGNNIHMVATKPNNSNSWFSLGSAILNGYVLDLKVDSDNNVVMVGTFTNVDNISGANNIVKWNISTSIYSSFGNGFDIYYPPEFNNNSLYIDSENNVYVCGHFSKVGDIYVNNIAVWTNTWNSLGSGLNGITAYGNAIIGSNNKVIYIGGSFIYAGNVVSNSIAQYS